MDTQNNSNNPTSKIQDFQSSFPNYKECDFALLPFNSHSQQPKPKLKPAISDPSDPVFTAVAPSDPLISSIHSLRSTPAIPNKLFSTPQNTFTPLKPEFTNTDQNNFMQRSEFAKMTLRKILSDFGVQFYIKVLQEYNKSVFISPADLFGCHEPASFLRKRGDSFGTISDGFIQPKINEMQFFKNSYNIQKINLTSAHRDSLFSFLNGNLQCPLLAAPEPVSSDCEEKTKPNNRFQNNANDLDNILDRLYQVICGESPEKTWLANWDPMQTQIFWLLLFKMGVLSDDWKNSLQKSSKFPSSRQKLKSVAYKTNMLTNRILIKILNRFYHHAHNKQCETSEAVLRKLLRIGKSDLVNSDFSHFSKIVGLKPNVQGPKRFIDISKIQNQYLNRRMKEVLCKVLVKQPQTKEFHWEVRSQVLTSSNEFQLQHRTKVFKKLKMAISKVENYFVNVKELPKIGLQMTKRQKAVFNKLKIPPPLQNWVEAFQQVKELFALIPFED